MRSSFCYAKVADSWTCTRLRESRTSNDDSGGPSRAGFTTAPWAKTAHRTCPEHHIQTACWAANRTQSDLPVLSACHANGLVLQPAATVTEFPRHTRTRCRSKIRWFEAARLQINPPCPRPAWLRKKARIVGRESDSVPRTLSDQVPVNASSTTSRKNSGPSPDKGHATRNLFQCEGSRGARLVSPSPTPLPTPSPSTTLRPRLARPGRHHANLSQAKLPLGRLLPLLLNVPKNSKKTAARVLVFTYESPIASNHAATLAVPRSG